MHGGAIIDVFYQEFTSKCILKNTIINIKIKKLRGEYMKNKKIFILTLAITSSLVVGCSKNNEEVPTEEKTQLVYCGECGQESKEVTKYCSNCGELAKWTAEKIEPKSEEESQDDKSSETNENSETTQSNNEKTTIDGRTEYINRLNQVEESMSDLEDLYGGSTIEMKEATGQSYERWDNMLNEIYSLLRQQLSTSVADDLKNKQVEWIKYRDKKAENDASEYTGGTMYGLIYVDSLGIATKERCYELVNTYMK